MRDVALPIVASLTLTAVIVAQVPITGGNELIAYLGKIRGAVGKPVTFTFKASPGG